MRIQRPVFKVPLEETSELVTRWTEECLNLLHTLRFHMQQTAKGYAASEALHVDEFVPNAAKLLTQFAVPQCPGLASARQLADCTEVQNALSKRSARAERGKDFLLIMLSLGPQSFYLSVLSLARLGFSSLCSVPLLDL